MSINYIYVAVWIDGDWVIKDYLDTYIREAGKSNDYIILKVEDHKDLDLDNLDFDAIALKLFYPDKNLDLILPENSNVH